ncbi:MAG: 7TM diverse intracellular signaling domain-containing protein [Agriterribacter sp.]
MLKRLTIVFLHSLLCFCVAAKNNDIIDVAGIQHYDTILKRLQYFVDYSKTYTIDNIQDDLFSHPADAPIFNARQLDANYFIKLTIVNTGQTDSFLLYAGKAQHYNMYIADSAGKKVLLNNHVSKFSPALSTQVPYVKIVLNKGEQKVFYINLKINFYNWYLFDPVILRTTDHAYFSFAHLLQPSGIYMAITIFFMGIMFCMFAYTFALFVRNPLWEYLYYSAAIFVFMVYFGLRLLNIFHFGTLYYLFYDLRYQGLQLSGLMLILLFMISFLKTKEKLPQFHKQVKALVYLQVIFLAVNLPLTYTNTYNYAANIAFDIIRILGLLYSAYIAIYLIVKSRKEEARYLGAGSLLSIFMACLALYVDRWGDFDELLLRYSGISVLLFMAGVMLQMTLFLLALSYRLRMQEGDRIRAVEQLQIENDRKELETFKAIIEARDNERTRISQEIHDDIGSGLTSIRLLSEIAKVKNEETDTKELEKISATSNVLMDKMNEIIWTLNSRNDTLLNLIAYLRHQIVEFFEPSHIILEINLPENIQDAPLSGNVRRNIILAVKEALHNIVKHSQASMVRVNFSFDEVFTISIKDNGIGFAADTATKHNNGLRNMKERLHSIGGLCEITSNEGTHILLKILLNVYPV